MQIYSEFTSCSIQTRSTQNKSSLLIFHFLFYGTHLCPQLWFDFSQIFPKMLASKALVHPDISCLTVSLLLLLFHFLILLNSVFLHVHSWVSVTFSLHTHILYLFQFCVTFTRCGSDRERLCAASCRWCSPAIILWTMLPTTQTRPWLRLNHKPFK